eukprot:5030140-Amphidinium_carterae.2
MSHATTSFFFEGATWGARRTNHVRMDDGAYGRGNRARPTEAGAGGGSCSDEGYVRRLREYVFECFTSRGPLCITLLYSAMSIKRRRMALKILKIASEGFWSRRYALAKHLSQYLAHNAD